MTSEVINILLEEWLTIEKQTKYNPENFDDERTSETLAEIKENPYYKAFIKIAQNPRLNILEVEEYILINRAKIKQRTADIVDMITMAETTYTPKDTREKILFNAYFRGNTTTDKVKEIESVIVVNEDKKAAIKILNYYFGKLRDEYNEQYKSAERRDLRAGLTKGEESKHVAQKRFANDAAIYINRGQYYTLQSGKIKYSELPDIIKGLNAGNTTTTVLRPAEITINKEELSQYFKAEFKGIGENHYNYFDTFCADLNNKSTKDLARIALMAYEGSNMNSRKPNSFAKWLRIFGKHIGVNIYNYKKRELAPGANIERQFNYL